MTALHTVFALRRRSLLGAGAALAATGPAWPQAAFDHSHAAWTALLKKHVKLIDGGKASALRYGGMAQDQAALRAYAASLSAVPIATFDGWTKAQRMAFLINAYNAYTVTLILTRYPKLESIKDLGSLISNPWKPKFIPLLGTTMSLDGIEHETLRARGRYDDPRIHFAVNCASIGCPMLREEAYVADRLDAQLDEQLQRFLGDRSRNRYNPAAAKLEVSKIFDWYGDDFKQGHRGITSLTGLLAKHADLLADAPADRDKIRRESVAVAFLDYNWKLNDAA